MMLNTFFRSRSGNFGILTAFAMVPLLGTAGLAIDFADAVYTKNALNSAADAAAVGAVAQKSPAVQKALTMTGDGVIDIGADDARKLFFGQASVDTTTMPVDVTTTVVKSGNNVTATVTYKASVPTLVSQVIGKKTIPISGQATAVYQTANFMDFYILIDNTPSMGVGATSTDITNMRAATTDNCAFACHNMDASKKSPSYYSIAKAKNITMRIDVVRQATQALTATAKDQRVISDQFRMAVYTFGQKAEVAGLTQVAGMTYDLNAVNAAIETDPNDPTKGVDLMTIPYANWNNDQTTYFDPVLTSLDKTIPNGGSGSNSTDRQQILFFVSDGVGDAAKGNKCTKPTTDGTRCQEPIDVTYCTPLKKRGVKIAVLYTTYLPLPENSWYNSWIKPFQNQIPSNMAACATPGLYFEVSPTQGINDAMQALFLKAIKMPRITS